MCLFFLVFLTAFYGGSNGSPIGSPVYGSSKPLSEGMGLPSISLTMKPIRRNEDDDPDVVKRSAVVDSITIAMAECGKNTSELADSLDDAKKDHLLELWILMRLSKEVIGEAPPACLCSLFEKYVENIENLSPLYDMVDALHLFFGKAQHETCVMLIRITAHSTQLRSASNVLKLMTPSLSKVESTEVVKEFVEELVETPPEIIQRVTPFVLLTYQIGMDGTCTASLVSALLKHPSNVDAAAIIGNSLYSYLETQPPFLQCQLLTPICQTDNDLGQVASLFEIIGPTLDGVNFSVVYNLIITILGNLEVMSTLSNTLQIVNQLGLPVNNLAGLISSTANGVPVVSSLLG